MPKKRIPRMKLDDAKIHSLVVRQLESWVDAMPPKKQQEAFVGFADASDGLTPLDILNHVRQGTELGREFVDHAAALAITEGLMRLGPDAAEPPAAPSKPAVPVRRSITPDFLICLEDGKKVKMLRRHLRSTYNMTPDQYRTKWGLAPDYPMVAPSYAEQRSQFAKKIGLGRATGRRVPRK